MDSEDEMQAEPAETPAAEDSEQREPSEGEKKFVETLQKRIRDDKHHHRNAFKQMREDMDIARLGADKTWIDGGNYTANVTGRHINQKVAALYAKNPKAIARRRERLDFAVWDEDVNTIMQAMMMAQTAMQAPPDPATGLTPEMLDPAVMQAVELVKDFQQGMDMRDRITRIGKTLEILFDYFTKEQTPVDFKTSMKHLVRRAATTGVGYVKIGFQREYDQDPETADRLADFTAQLQHVEFLMEKAQDEDTTDLESTREELRLSVQSLQEQQYVLLREGLVFDFPESNRVIPDKMCRNLTGFVGARHVTVEFMYTVEEVEKTFGKKLNKGRFARHGADGTRVDAQPEFDFGGEIDTSAQDNLVCVWEHFDRASGTVYYLADGYEGYLRPPGAPDVYVEDFWPVYALTFNEVEHPDHLFPPSDVRLIRDMQQDYNRARQGLREHRQFARPRFVSRKGALSDEDKEALATAEPFTVTELNTEDDIGQVLAAIDVPGVDPNLYETGQTMTDVQLVIGAQEAQFGAVAKATATESAIADDSRMASVSSNVDDLDAFLMRLAKASGQVLFKEMSAETVQQIAGPGAVWPEMTLEEIAQEVYLEIEAGSTGKPNQAAEVKNWREMLPFLVQMPGISPTWLARETLRRLDDRMDLTDALAENLPSIVQMNSMQQPSPADPADAPAAQGGEGADRTPDGPERTEGSDAPMGNNRV